MSTISGKIAKKYASALFRSFDTEQLGAVETALTQVAEVWSNDADFRARFTSPTVLATEKTDALMEIGEVTAKACGVNPSDYFARFLVILEENGRFAGIGEVAESFSVMIQQLRKELAITVVTAAEVSEAERSIVLQKLKGFGTSSDGSSLSTIEWEVDPELIGGAVIRCGDKEVDGSVHGALEEARLALLG